MSLQRGSKALWRAQQCCLVTHHPSTFLVLTVLRRLRGAFGCRPRRQIATTNSGQNQHLALVVLFAELLEHLWCLVKVDCSRYKTIDSHSVRGKHALNEVKIAR